MAGADTIRGQGGWNLIVGGEGDDPLLKGGDQFNVILGDDFEIKAAP